MSRNRATAQAESLDVTPPAAPARTAKASPPAERGRRADILNAAVETVLSQGYARTTVSQVARAADVPRPLVQYYFPTRESLLRAAIEKIATEWRENYFSRLFADHGGDSIGISEGIDRLWAHMHEPLFKAYQELLFAARTDPALAELMRDAHREGETRRYEAGAQTYANYVKADAQAYIDTSEFTAIFLEGLLTHRFRKGDDEASVQRQLSLLKHMLGRHWAERGLTTEGVPMASGEVGEDEREELSRLARELIERLKALT